MRSFIRIRHVLLLVGDMAAVKVLKNALCFIMGYFVAMETYDCYVTFICVYLCNVHIIGPINVCTNFEISRYNIDEFRKYAKIACFIGRHVTQKWYVVYHSGSDPKLVMTQCVFVMFLVTLTLTFDLHSTFYHTKYACSTGVSLQSFIRIRQVLMGDTAADTHTNKQTHTEGKNNSLANPVRARLIS